MPLFDSPAEGTSISPPSNPGGSAVAEVPGLPGKTPSLINPDSRCDSLGTPGMAPIRGPAEVYVTPGDMNSPSVHGPGHGTMDSPASGNPIKYGGG